MIYIFIHFIHSFEASRLSLHAENSIEKLSLEAAKVKCCHQWQTALAPLVKSQAAAGLSGQTASPGASSHLK